MKVSRGRAYSQLVDALDLGLLGLGLEFLVLLSHIYILIIIIRTSAADRLFLFLLHDVVVRGDGLQHLPLRALHHVSGDQHLFQNVVCLAQSVSVS